MAAQDVVDFLIQDRDLPFEISKVRLNYGKWAYNDGVDPKRTSCFQSHRTTGMRKRGSSILSDFAWGRKVSSVDLAREKKKVFIAFFAQFLLEIISRELHFHFLGFGSFMAIIFLSIAPNPKRI